MNEQHTYLASERFKAMAHPIRVDIYACLTRFPSCNVTQLQEILKLPQPTLSQHLSKMQRSGILNRARKGTEIYYSIADGEAIQGASRFCDLDLSVHGEELVKAAGK